MKKILLSLFVFAVIGFTAKVQAQCSVALSNVTVQIISTGPAVGSNPCTVVANVEFDLEYNSGAKFVYFNSYLAADYAALAISNPLDFDCGNASTPARDAPNAGRLGTTISQPGKSFLDIGLDLTAGHGAVGVPVATTVLTTYSQDITVALNTPANSGGYTVTRTFISGTKDHFVISNLQVSINGACNSTIAVNTDIWASNANSSNAKAQCYQCGKAQFFNDPSVSGFSNCNYPRQYNIGITTVDPVAKNVTYKVYLDMDGSGGINGGDVLAYTSGTISISSSSPYSAGPLTLGAPYSTSNIYASAKYLILVEGLTLSNSIVYLMPGGSCSPLPVSFKSFTATRNRSNVLTKWETSSEQNNSGFAVERNLNGTWEQVAFVPSQAANGNSTTDLSYQFNDLNNSKGITQYRIKQIDLDAKSKYSEIRSVRGDGQKGKTIIYPNPSTDGKVNIVFEEANVIRDISVMDMAGRTVKQMKGVTNNNITIENLNPGMYTLRVLVPATGDQTVEKIIVNKR